ncbi:hypothetical protein [Algoriphagus litoralis]|uniref:hypothetical protein n=1 Tax=Algoriphagus litoralis TaxID=2202829 RepID=UPI000DBA5032|nr:hypothetical protein [Algoriphagus litoralis]
MEIRLSEKELQFFIEKNGESEVKFEITGLDEFLVHHPKATVSCRLLEYTARTFVIGYDLGFWKNLAVNWFVKLEKEGIIWDKKQKRFEIDPFSFLPEKEKIATQEFTIEKLSLEPGMMVVRLGIIPS